MPELKAILKIDKPHFTVSLYANMLKIDLKGSIKNEIEEALENKPILRETIGNILGIFAPLHIRLSDIDDVRPDESGKVKIILPRHRDVTLPLRPAEAKKLVIKLNELIPAEKRREALRVMRAQTRRKIAEAHMGLAHAPAPGVGYVEPELEEDLAEAEEKEEQKKED